MPAERRWQRARRAAREREGRRPLLSASTQGRPGLRVGRTDAALASLRRKLSLQGFWRPLSSERNHSDEKSQPQPSTRLD